MGPAKPTSAAPPAAPPPSVGGPPVGSSMGSYNQSANPAVAGSPPGMPTPSGGGRQFASSLPAPQAAATAAANVPAPPPLKSNPNSTQNTLQIAEIRDGVVIMNDGSYRSVVMCKSINFDLMSPDERESIEYAFQGFLNSLYFEVQIFIHTTRVDIRPYLEKLDKIRSEHDNMLLALLMEDYINYIDNLAAQTNIMDKKFYVIIPYYPIVDIQKAITQSKNFFTGLVDMFNSKEKFVTINEPDLNKAKDELRNRVQAVMGALQQAGVKSLPLDTQELIELYYDTYNPDTATRQQLKNFDDLTVPIVTKGKGEANQPHLDTELGNG